MFKKKFHDLEKIPISDFDVPNSIELALVYKDILFAVISQIRWLDFFQKNYFQIFNSRHFQFSTNFHIKNSLAVESIELHQKSSIDGFFTILEKIQAKNQ
jgi:hypothetical protein